MRYKLIFNKFFSTKPTEREQELIDQILQTGSDFGWVKGDDSPKPVELTNIDWSGSHQTWWIKPKKGYEKDAGGMNLYFTSDESLIPDGYFIGYYNQFDLKEVASGGKRRKRARKTKNYKKSRSRKRFSRKQ